MLVLRLRTTAVRGLRFSTASQQPSDPAELRLRILAAALQHVPKTGWTKEALALGAVDSGLPPMVHGIFKRGPIELVEYFQEVV